MCKWIASDDVDENGFRFLTRVYDNKDTEEIFVCETIFTFITSIRIYAIINLLFSADVFRSHILSV